MTEKLQQTIKEKVAQLPKEMREAISSFNWVKITEEIAKKNNLNEDELNNFQLETLLVLIGIVDIKYYAINIENQVNITKDKAERIAVKAFESIFNPIGKIVESSLKENLKNKKLNIIQNIDFILSGGDYSAFLEKDNT